MVWSTGKEAVVKKENPAKDLLNAIKFVKPVFKRNNSPEHFHCAIGGGWLCASGRVITMGIKIKENLSCCPHIKELEPALKKVENDCSMTQVSEFDLSIVSGDMKAMIQCCNPNQVSIAPPEEIACKIDDNLKQAFSVLEKLPDKESDKTKGATVWVKENIAAASDNKGLIEYWHGLNLPEMLIPIQAIKAIVGCKKSLKGFGYNQSSATFYFEDDSFIQTRLYKGSIPNYEHLLELDEDFETYEVPKQFFEAVKTVNSLTKEKILYFKDGKVMSKELEKEASTYKINQLPNGLRFDSTFLLKVEKAFKKVYFNLTNNRAYFFGDNCRGLIQARLKIED